MNYELWNSESGYSFFPTGNESARQLLDPDANLVQIFEAESWDEARGQMHRFLGWEPYKPMGQS